MQWCPPYQKGPRIVTYRDYNRFDNLTFREKVAEEFNSNPLTMQDFSSFNSIIKCILDKEAPLKKKCLTANDGPFMTRELRKAIMKRTRLKNSFNKMRTNENRAASKKQRNLCVKILHQNKKFIMLNLIQRLSVTTRSFGKL